MRCLCDAFVYWFDVHCFQMCCMVVMSAVETGMSAKKCLCVDVVFVLYCIAFRCVCFMLYMPK